MIVRLGAVNILRGDIKKKIVRIFLKFFLRKNFKKMRTIFSKYYAICLQPLSKSFNHSDGVLQFLGLSFPLHDPWKSSFLRKNGEISLLPKNYICKNISRLYFADSTSVGVKIIVPPIDRQVCQQFGMIRTILLRLLTSSVIAVLMLCFQ